MDADAFATDALEIEEDLVGVLYNIFRLRLESMASSKRVAVSTSTLSTSSEARTKTDRSRCTEDSANSTLSEKCCCKDGLVASFLLCPTRRWSERMTTWSRRTGRGSWTASWRRSPVYHTSTTVKSSRYYWDQRRATSLRYSAFHIDIREVSQAFLLRHHQQIQGQFLRTRRRK